MSKPPIEAGGKALPANDVVSDFRVQRKDLLKAFARGDLAQIYVLRRVLTGARSSLPARLQPMCDGILSRTEIPLGLWAVYAHPNMDPMLRLSQRFVRERERYNVMQGLDTFDEEMAHYSTHVEPLWDELHLWTPPCTSMEGAAEAIKLALVVLEEGIGGFGPNLLEEAAAFHRRRAEWSLALQ